MLPWRTPTLQSMSTKNWMRVDNVFCTDNLESAVVSCDTNPSLQGPGTDHMPILTVLEIEAAYNMPEPFCNFHMTEWDAFWSCLSEKLKVILLPQELETEEEFENAVCLLTQVIQDVIHEEVPLSKPVPHSCWW